MKLSCLVTFLAASPLPPAAAPAIHRFMTAFTDARDSGGCLHWVPPDQKISQAAALLCAQWS